MTWITAWRACFNPRPPSLTGERHQPHRDVPNQLFQSTPAIADGRTMETTSVPSAIRGFQSTPAIADGRTSGWAANTCKEVSFQSTPAIADGRTAPLRAASRALRLFQSTPAIADGRTAGGGGVWAPSVVSIHARHR